MTTPQPSLAAERVRVDLGGLRVGGVAGRAAPDAPAGGSPRVGQPRARHRASIPACLPEQLWWISLRRPALLDAELEIVLRRLGPREQRANSRDLLGRVAMRGARDRELVVRQVVAGPHERQRLERLGGGAHEARQRRVARRGHDLAAAHGDGVNPVHRLDDSVAAHLDDDRLAHAREPYADLRMVDICRMVGRCRP